MKERLYMSHCIFPTPDIKRTATYYKEVLGFRVEEYLDVKDPHICLYRDFTEIILTKSNGQEVIPNRKLYGYGYDAYFITGSQEILQEELEYSGAKIVRKLLHTD